MLPFSFVLRDPIGNHDQCGHQQLYLELHLFSMVQAGYIEDRQAPGYLFCMTIDTYVAHI